MLHLNRFVLWQPLVVLPKSLHLCLVEPPQLVVHRLVQRLTPSFWKQHLLSQVVYLVCLLHLFVRHGLPLDLL